MKIFQDIYVYSNTPIEAKVYYVLISLQLIEWLE
jgi:hypothetical protein